MKYYSEKLTLKDIIFIFGASLQITDKLEIVLVVEITR